MQRCYIYRKLQSSGVWKFFQLENPILVVYNDKQFSASRGIPPPPTPSVAMQKVQGIKGPACGISAYDVS